MSFLEKIKSSSIFSSKKEFSILLIIISLSSLAGVGLAYTIERFVLRGSSQNQGIVAEPNPSKLATVVLPKKSIVTSSSVISSSSQRPKILDLYGRKITYNLQKSGINAGYIWDTDIRDLGQTSPFDGEMTPEVLKNAPQQPTPLDEIIPAPKDCPGNITDGLNTTSIKQKKNWFIYPQYQVEAPILNGSFSDFYISDQSGKININQPIEEDQREINRGNYESVPVQKLLKQGIVHLPISPAPGQVGNSYIIGHTSNFPKVKSDYNYIFKPFERNSKVGEEFFVWDHQCRKMKFVVFESLAIREEDIDTAYKNFGDRRVITLQGSILELVNGYLQPTKRWLTRGELVLDK